MTPREFRDAVLGKRFDVDNFPPSNPYQCFDLFAYCLMVLNIPVDTYCAITGYVSDLWKLRDQYGYYQYFDYIYDAKQLINGDWCFWERGNSSHPSGHVCMFYDGKALGQNQPYNYVTEKNTTWDIMGALRPKFWKQPKKGYAECFDADIAGTYKCMYPLHLRTGGDITYPSLCVMNKGERVQCYGYYHVEKNRIWLYVTYKNMTGFACMDYLSL